MDIDLKEKEKFCKVRLAPPPGAPRAAAAMRERTTNLSILTRVSLPCCAEQKLK